MQITITTDWSICPYCGRRSFQMPNACRRKECGLQQHDSVEKTLFLSLCERQKLKMTTLKFYERRRRNTLKTAAKALNRKIKATDENDIQRCNDRVIKFASHVILLDEIWIFLNPARQFCYGFGVYAELVSAAKRVRDDSFDDYYDNYYGQNGIKRIMGLMAIF